MERSDARPLVHRVIIERRQFSEDSVSLSFFSALVVASLIIGSLASHAQVLSYSAYTDLVLLPQIAVNASGE